MPQLRVSLNIGYANSTIEDIIDIDAIDWDSCTTDEEREDLINEYWKGWAENFIDGGARIVEQEG